MGLSFEEILKKKRTLAGVKGAVQATTPTTTAVTEPETPVENTAEQGIEEELILPEGLVEDSTAEDEALSLPEGLLEEAPQQTFDTSTVVTPELVAGMDYETLYSLSLPDSPLAPEQRFIVANALRGSSDLWDLFSGYDPQTGLQVTPIENPTHPKNRGTVAKNYNTAVSTAVAGNTAVLEAVKAVRQRYLDENPQQVAGTGEQLLQGVMEGTAAPRPEGETGTPIASKSRIAKKIAANSALFNFGDEILSVLGIDSNVDVEKKALEETNPNMALGAELFGAVVSPSAGLKAIQTLGMGLKAVDKGLKTAGKLAAASAVDTAIASVGEKGFSDTTLSDTALGAVAGGLTTFVPVLGKLFLRAFAGEKSAAEAAKYTIATISEKTRIPADRLESELKKNNNILEVLTTNGLSVEDAGRVLSDLAKEAPTNEAAAAIRANATEKVNKVNSKSADQVTKYLESIDPRAAGKTIEKLYGSVSGSDLSELTARLLNTDGSPMISDAIRNAVAQRTAANSNILAGSGRSTVKAEDILIDRETGNMFVPNLDAKKLTDEQLTEDSLFGYAREDLHELTGVGGELRGDIFPSADSKLASKMTFKEGEAPDQDYAVVVKRVRDEASAIVNNSVEGLADAKKVYSSKKASRDAFDLTNAFVKKTAFEPKDVDAYVETMNNLASISDKDRKKAVFAGLRNFFGSNTKTSDILTSSGAFNPEFVRAMNKVGVNAEDLKAYESMAKDKVFFSQFLQGTGVGAPDKSTLADFTRKFSAQLFFHPPIVAIKNAAFSMIGVKATSGIGNVANSKNYGEIVKGLASLKDSDFAKIQKLVEEGNTNFMDATVKYVTRKSASAIARTLAVQ